MNIPHILFCFWILILYTAFPGQMLAQGMQAEHETSATELFKIIVNEDYNSLSRFIPPIEAMNFCNSPKKDIESKREEFNQEYRDNFQIAHDSLGIDFYTGMKICCIGSEIEYPTVFCPKGIDSVKTISVTLIVEGLFTYYEVIFSLWDIEGKSKLFSPIIRTKSLKIVDRKSSADFTQKNFNK